MATDRDRIRNTARERGWGESLRPPRSVVFYKGSRSVYVTFDSTGSTPVEASHGMKQIRARNLAREIIETLRKD